MPRRPAALLCEPHPQEYDPQLRSALGWDPGLVDTRAHGDIFSGGHPAAWNRLLKVLRALMLVADLIQHPVVDQERYRQRTGVLQHAPGDIEIDRIAKIFGGAHAHANRGPLPRPSPRAGRVRSEVLNEVLFGV